MLVIQENKKTVFSKGFKRIKQRTKSTWRYSVRPNFPPPEIKKPLVIQKGGYFIFAGVGEVCWGSRTSYNEAQDNQDQQRNEY